MVLPKSKQTVGLGNALMNDRFGKGKGADRKKVSQQGVVRMNHATGESYVTNAAKEASWVKMRSVTEQGALDEFLSTAELAGTDFTAEKMNSVKIIHADQKNPYLLSADEEQGVKRKQARNRGRLTVPRRPKWDESTTPQQLDEMERASLLEWRRGLASLQENDDLLMTPFERNIEVWRQLWRVIERSDLIVQIVDARNPLLFRSEDLERYVKEVDKTKRNLLLVNKADMMTQHQRKAWADYFVDKEINYKFFSAHLAKEMNEGKDALEDLIEREDRQTVQEKEQPEKEMVQDVQDLNLKEQEEEQQFSQDDNDDESGEDRSDSDERTRILTVDELESLFLENIQKDSAEGRKTIIGLVGYPNVGKSSTINALIGAKKVSVSATPGKTKHFQTIHLSDKVILCDCPGLVFPNFATTKAELVCAGVLPIDQLREFTGPAGLVAQRIPQSFLENVYGMKIHIRALDEGGTGWPTASEVLRAYARARGFATTGHGQPDESRAARYVLKDYVNGKLLYCHPPPAEPEIDGQAFNADLYDFAHLPAKRQAWLISHSDELPESEIAPEVPLPTGGQRQTGSRAKQLDKGFFGAGSGNAGHVTMPFNHKYTEHGKQLSGRKAKTMTALEKDVDPAELRMAGSKKHFKPSRTKTRNAFAKDEDDD
jgi:large subunit GTPase 1